MIELCYGLVEDVKNKPLSVKVRLPDYDNLITPWLSVLTPRSLGSKHYDPPVKDEQVACLMDNHFESGLCLGSVYSDEDLEPAEGDVYAREFSDGTRISYNPSESLLTVASVKKVIVTAVEELDLVSAMVRIRKA